MIPATTVDDDPDGVVDLAREGGVTAELFGRFCRNNLCMKSWDFVVAAVQYDMVHTAEGNYG